MERNLRLYPWFSALAFTPCFVPVVVLFWQANGLDLQAVFWLQGLFALAVVLLEVPTGMVADRLGKRTSLLCGELALLTGLGIYAMGTGFWTFLLAEVVLALGAALFSGADSALLYDTLKALDRVHEYSEREGRAKGWSLLTFAFANLVASFGTRGDVDPFLALARGLRSAGHEATVCAPPDYGATARALASCPQAPPKAPLPAASELLMDGLSETIRRRWVDIKPRS